MQWNIMFYGSFQLSSMGIKMVKQEKESRKLLYHTNKHFSHSNKQASLHIYNILWIQNNYWEAINMLSIGVLNEHMNHAFFFLFNLVLFFVVFGQNVFKGKSTHSFTSFDQSIKNKQEKNERLNKLFDPC
jgi:hypothetical protein